jgi:hypothetical protein
MMQGRVLQPDGAFVEHPLTFARVRRRARSASEQVRLFVSVPTFSEQDTCDSRESFNSQ